MGQSLALNLRSSAGEGNRKMKHKVTICGLAVLFLTFIAPAQEVTPQRPGVPIYNVTVIERSTKAVNYQYRSGPTVVDLRGTVLMSEAKGTATVESKRGRTEIEIAVDKLVPPTRFGREYLTYTLWAITPEGAPRNIGEVIPNGSDKARLRITTDLQAFGLIVTAEPYSAARQPSDVVVLENEIRPDTVGQIKPIQAKYELMPRGHYTWDVADKLKSDVAGAPKVSMDRYEAMLQLYEAQNAAGIARAASAEQYAPQTFGKAQELLAEAQRLQDSKAASSLIVQTAREAAQTAEDARQIAEKRRQEEKVDALATEAAKAQNARVQAEGEAQRARIDAESARAEANAERTARERAEADAADARRQAAQPAVVVVPAPPPQAHAGPTKLDSRMRLVEQLNGVLVTRDTPRGVVATLSDSSFSGSELRGGVASRIARLAAILAAYPDLRIVVEGSSDSAGNDSQATRRAESVRQALIANGMAANRSAIRALGDSRPLVSNSSASGREQNRRVEIVISGDSIGTLPFWDRTYSLMTRRP
jgi:outer membrane protein OmpA-like peptidoglycan-associated protein